MSFRFSHLIRLIKFPSVLSPKEKIITGAALLTFMFLSVYLSVAIFMAITEPKPAFGGTYTEGVVGQPRLINPIYAISSDIDRDLTELLFSGLMTYNTEGKIVPQLALNYKISDDEKVYEFELNPNAKWHDGTPITADDVVFTIKTIQNPIYQSPLRANWLSVDVEKLSQNKIRFTLPKPYVPFIELTTIKILPKHIWKDIAPENFLLTEKNLKTVVGSGPYKLDQVILDNNQKVKSIILKINLDYFGPKPLIETLKFVFLDSEKELILAAKNGTIDGFAPSMAKNYILENMTEYRFTLLRYFAVFFNNTSEILSDQNVRRALAIAINYPRLLKNVFNDKATVVNSPLMPEILGLKEPEIKYSFDKKEAQQILDDTGFKINPETGMRRLTINKEPAFQLTRNLTFGSRGKEVEELQKCLAKDPEIYPGGEITGYFGNKTKTAVIKFQEKYKEEVLVPAGLQRGNGKVGPLTRKKLNSLCFPAIKKVTDLKFSLTTANTPPLPEIAQELKQQWKEIGVDVQLQTLEISDLITKIKERDYEAILFGQALGTIADPFPFWHSIQKRDPGLNLTFFGSKEADDLLIKARETTNVEERKEALEKVQDLILEDIPAIFIARPDYLYFVSPKIKGIQPHIIPDPSKRFVGIENWYIKTRRVLK